MIAAIVIIVVIVILVFIIFGRTQDEDEPKSRFNTDSCETAIEHVCVPRRILHASQSVRLVDCLSPRMQTGKGITEKLDLRQFRVATWTLTPCIDMHQLRNSNDTSKIRHKS